jgi:CSLREA domain-containing protein
MPFRWTLLAAHLALAAGAAARGETVYRVDSPHDVVDDNLLDGICHTVAGTCTLRAAIQEANRTPAGTNAAILLPEGQFAISIPPDILNGEGSGDFDFTTPASGERTIHIYGGGTERSIVDAGFVDRVFDVGDAVHLRLHDLALGNGAAFGAAGDSGGGGIKARGDVELHRVEVRGCSAAYGGAVWVPAGGTAHLRAYDTTFRDNTAGEGGGCTWRSSPSWSGRPSTGTGRKREGRSSSTRTARSAW